MIAKFYSSHNGEEGGLSNHPNGNSLPNYWYKADVKSPLQARRVPMAQQGMGFRRLIGNARYHCKSTNTVHECLTESQAIENGLVRLTKSEMNSVVGAMIEPNNFKLTQQMLDEGIILYRQKGRGWKTNNIYAVCPGHLDKNAVPFDLSTGHFEESSLKESSFTTPRVIRTYYINKFELPKINQGVSFNDKGNMTLRNGVVIPYEYTWEITPNEYAASYNRTLYFRDYCDEDDYYFFKGYNLREMINNRQK